MRCGTSGASRHVTAKPSIGKRGVLYKSGVYAQKALSLTPGDLSCAVGRRVRLKLAEERAIDPDRMRAAVAFQAMAGQGSQYRLLRNGRRV
jgi:hypothetical protein